MAASQLKLTYFDMTGRAELSRLLFTFGDIAFEDKRIQFTDMPALKPTLPLGQLPALEVDGTTYVQSMAIARYAAKLAGLYPQDATQALLVDMVSETLSELRNQFSGILHGGFDDATRALKFSAYKQETAPKALGALEKLVQGTYFLGDHVTLADVHLYDIAVNMLWARLELDIASAFPKLQRIVERVRTTERIAAYLLAREQAQQNA